MINIIKDNLGLYSFTVIILIYLVSMFRKSNKEYLLSKEQFNIIKAISAIGIVLHHSSQKIGLNILTLPFEEIGKYSVAIFFMLSGYGIMISYLNNRDYLNKFICKRIIKIYIPFMISNLVLIAIRSIKGQTFSIIDVVKNIIGINLLDATMWFVITILMLNLIFYILFKNLKIDNAIMGMSIIIGIYFIIGVTKSVGGHKIDAIFSFIIGVLLAYKKERFISIVCSRWILCFSILTVSSVGFRVVAFAVNNITLNLLSLNVSTILFALLIITLGYKVKIKSNIISFIGIISFEIYLLHMKCMEIVPNLNSNIINFIIYIFILLISSYYLYKINTYIKSKLLINKENKNKLIS